MNTAAVKLNMLLSRVLSTVPAEKTQTNGDIILRTLIGMAFIMVMIWLAAIIAGKIGSRFHPGGWFAEQDEAGENSEDPDENENNDIGGNING